MEYIGLLLILLAGMLNPIQTGVNSTLRNSVRTPFLSSTVSFVVGSISLMLLTLLTCGRLLPTSESVAGLPWWAWCGGVMGVIGLTGNIFLFPKLGGVLTVIVPMIGQILISMLIDTFGWFNTTPIPFGMGRIIGLVLVLVGLGLYMHYKRTTQQTSAPVTLWPWIMLGLLIGFAFAVQPVMNGRLATAISSSIHTAFISFSTSLIILLVIVLALPKERRNVPLVITAKRPWWTWTGGLIGAYFVSVFAMVTPWVGVGIVSLTGILGMLLSGALVDSRGWFGRTPQPLRVPQYIGLLLVFIGVVCIKLM